MSSPIDLPLIFKKIYSTSNVASSSGSIPLVKTHALINPFIASAISLSSSDSSANRRTFSSLTKNGLYFIFFLVEGTVNSYVGVLNVGNAISYDIGILYSGVM